MLMQVLPEQKYAMLADRSRLSIESCSHLPCPCLPPPVALRARLEACLAFFCDATPAQALHTTLVWPPECPVWLARVYYFSPSVLRLLYFARHTAGCTARLVIQTMQEESGAFLESARRGGVP